MRKRIFGQLLVICTAILLMSAFAFAESNTGAFSVTGGSYDTDYTYADGILTIKTSEPLTIANTNPSQVTTDVIVIEKDVAANVTLAGVNIDVSDTGSVEGNTPVYGKAALAVFENSTADVTISLAENTTNTLKSGKMCAGLQKNGSGGILTIEGAGTLNAIGGDYGPGIGSGALANASGIEIKGGTVNAVGGLCGAGIGSGSGLSGEPYNGKNITVSGGTVNADGGMWGAGIGGGYEGSGFGITITGGNVTANGGAQAAGIGGGYGGCGFGLSITENAVTATANKNGASDGEKSDAYNIGNGGASNGNYVGVYTADEFKAAYTAGIEISYIKLMADIKTDSDITINGELTLDLNGHILEAADDTGVFIRVGDNSSLILCDKGDNKGQIKGGKNYAVVIDRNAKLTVKGGNIVSEEYSILANNYAELTMTGGSVGHLALSENSKMYADGGTVQGVIYIEENAVITQGTDAKSTTYFSGEVINSGKIEAGIYKNEISGDGNTEGITVTFSIGTSTPYATTIVRSGSKLIAPENPTKTGYTFNAWYKEANCRTAWDFDTDTVTENISLYAKWIRIGGGSHSSVTVKPDDSAATDTEKDLISDIKEGISEYLIVARSAKTQKGNVKVSVSAVSDGSGSEVSFDSLEAAGYTVKYKFYKSTKKSSAYKAAIEKNHGESYINTSGTKGTRYYYKLRLAIYDKDGNLVAQTALKQCRYACRIWTK